MIFKTTGRQVRIPSFDEGRTYTSLHDVCSGKVRNMIRRGATSRIFHEGRTYLFDFIEKCGNGKPLHQWPRTQPFFIAHEGAVSSRKVYRKGLGGHYLAAMVDRFRLTKEHGHPCQLFASAFAD